MTRPLIPDFEAGIYDFHCGNWLKIPIWKPRIYSNSSIFERKFLDFNKTSDDRSNKSIISNQI